MSTGDWKLVWKMNDWKINRSQNSIKSTGFWEMRGTEKFDWREIPWIHLNSPHHSNEFSDERKKKLSSNLIKWGIIKIFQFIIFISRYSNKSNKGGQLFFFARVKIIYILQNKLEVYTKKKIVWKFNLALQLKVHWIVFSLVLF